MIGWRRLSLLSAMEGCVIWDTKNMQQTFLKLSEHHSRKPVCHCGLYARRAGV